MTTLTRHGSPPSLGHDNRDSKPTAGPKKGQRARGYGYYNSTHASSLHQWVRALGNAPSSYTSPKEMKVRNTT